MSCKRRNLNYSNLQILLPRNIAWYSKSFIHICGRKQKLSLSKLKNAILQLNTRYLITTTAITKMRIKLIVWNYFKRTSIHQIHLILIHWNITYGVQCLTCRPTNVTRQSRPTLKEVKNDCASDLSGIVSRPKLIQQCCRSAKHAKSSWWIFRTCCLNRCSTSTYHVSLQ